MNEELQKLLKIEMIAPKPKSYFNTSAGDCTGSMLPEVFSILSENTSIQSFPMANSIKSVGDIKLFLRDDELQNISLENLTKNHDLLDNIMLRQTILEEKQIFDPKRYFQGHDPFDKDPFDFQAPMSAFFKEIDRALEDPKSTDFQKPYLVQDLKGEAAGKSSQANQKTGIKKEAVLTDIGNIKIVKSPKKPREISDSKKIKSQNENKMPTDDRSLTPKPSERAKMRTPDRGEMSKSKAFISDGRSLNSPKFFKTSKAEATKSTISSPVSKITAFLNESRLGRSPKCSTASKLSNNNEFSLSKSVLNEGMSKTEIKSSHDSISSSMNKLVFKEHSAMHNSLSPLNLSKKFNKIRVMNEINSDYFESGIVRKEAKCVKTYRAINSSKISLENDSKILNSTQDMKDLGLQNGFKSKFTTQDSSTCEASSYINLCKSVEITCLRDQNEPSLVEFVKVSKNNHPVKKRKYSESPSDARAFFNITGFEKGYGKVGTPSSVQKKEIFTFVKRLNIPAVKTTLSKNPDELRLVASSREVIEKGNDAGILADKVCAKKINKASTLEESSVKKKSATKMNNFSPRPEKNGKKEEKLTGRVAPAMGAKLNNDKSGSKHDSKSTARGVPVQSYMSRKGSLTKNV